MVPKEQRVTDADVYMYHCLLSVRYLNVRQDLYLHTTN